LAESKAHGGEIAPQMIRGSKESFPKDTRTYLKIADYRLIFFPKLFSKPQIMPEGKALAGLKAERTRST
jgi:hypothetical protein